MNVREYLSVRRAYALVRQGMPYADRLTFEELAILCHLSNASSPLRTSEVAEYQGVMRPTMTHRTSHLARLGLIERTSGERDRRSVCCALSQEGRLRLDSALLDMCASIKPGMPLSRCTPDRMRRVVDTMGSVTLSSADLVLLGLATYGEGEGLAVCVLVDKLGLLQPTVSMAVASLCDSGLALRASAGNAAGRGPLVAATEKGSVRISEASEHINSLHVHTPRKRRDD